MGALTLYMDFINLFINLLQLFGVKRDWSVAEPVLGSVLDLLVHELDQQSHQ
jgi:hypothetical protein